MHIKNITIAGFKSYRDQSFDTPFSAAHNVIVGKNGSGKSNFFGAIQFVLSEKYATLRQNERKDLLHAGAGAPVMSAYVEITFDNSDGRLVLPGMSETTEVNIRRTVGVQKDEFRVNDKGFSAADVRQLLESAGFSASNPYYIVEQGRIIHLTNMSETERLDLLKEVAGTKVYEERRAESTRILEETTEKRKKIDENIDKLKARLQEVEAEREEWKKYQALEKQRKGLEFTLYNTELTSARTEMNELEQQRTEVAGTYDKQFAKSVQIHTDIKAAERAAHDLSRQITAMERERKLLDNERIEILRRRAKLDLSLQEARDLVGDADGERKNLSKEAQDLTKAVEKGKKDLTTKQSQFDAKSSVCEQAEKDLVGLETRMKQMQTKRGQRKLFKNKAERDAWLQEEIDKNKQFVAQHKKDLAKIAEQERSIQEALKTDEELAEKRRTDVTKNDAAITEKESNRLAALKQRDDLHAERRELFQRIHEAETRLRKVTEEKDRQQSTLNKAMGSHDIRTGLRTVQEVLNEMGEKDKSIRKAVHGPIIELMKVDPRFFTAVEVTVGNALYNVVVDSFDTSAKILDYMNRNKKPGRVTFLPLDTCIGKKKDIPTTRDVTPLISHAQFDDKYKGVFYELLGRTAVASSLSAAAEASKQYDCDAITLDGDQINRKGGVHGGFMQRASRLQAFLDGERLNSELNEATKALDALKKDLVDVEQRMAKVMQTVENAAGQSTTLRDTIEEERRETRQAYERIARHQQQLVLIRESKHTAERTLEASSETVKLLTEEMSSNFKAEFGSEEERELEKLHTQVTADRTEASKKRSEVTTLATEIQVLEGTLGNMRRRLDAIQERISKLSHNAAHVDKEHLTSEDKTVSAQLVRVEGRISAIDKEITALTRAKQKHDEVIQDHTTAEATMSKAFNSEREELEKYNAKRALLASRIEDCNLKIRKLGAIPNDVAQYEGMPVARIMAQLKKIAVDLRSFAHVNKKALEQYSALSEAHDDLCSKRDTNEHELSSIHEMMLKLDSQKDQAIERTVKQVQFQFEKVFHELVTARGASAELQLLKTKETARKQGVEAYVGVRVRVCFGIGSPVTELSQLSGGQKSLVALALIFAIQRCDPAPFYIFDEIDAALDEDYRTAVAAMIQRQSKEAQFITATFKTEMLDVADKVYCIQFRNRVSRVLEVTKDEAAVVLRQAALSEKRDRDDMES
eukprot:PhM_4_TR13256/c0_g1_i1/m.100909/K06669/SMC3, CSPG6; structural maintenance of chromosome 3 (chondroitin sulfate proteoglycan 6)